MGVCGELVGGAGALRSATWSKSVVRMGTDGYGDGLLKVKPIFNFF